MQLIRRMAAFAAIALVLPLTAIGSTSSTAQALDPTGSISGTVTLGTQPVEGLLMTLIDIDANHALSGLTTDANGAYEFAALEPGDYLVFAQGGPEAFPSRFFGDTAWQPDATVITVGTDPVADIDISYLPGVIEGTVYWRGVPVTGGSVGLNAGPTNSVGATIDASGHYRARFLPFASYSLTAFAANSSVTRPMPVVIDATTPVVSGVDFVIPPGVITGNVLDASGAPATNAQVTATEMMGGQFNVPLQMTGDGSFIMSALPEGTYQVRATWNGATTPSVPVTIAPGSYDATGVTLQFPAPTTISGTVTREGVTQAYTSVYLTPIGGGMANATTTNGSGVYTFPSVTPGTYAVSAMEPTTMAQWYHPGTPDQLSATPVTITEGQQLNGIDIVIDIPDPASISGVVTDGVDGVGGVTVQVWRPSIWWMAAATTLTAPDGSYSLSGLPAGESLQVQFVPPGGSAFLGEWFDDAPDRNSATSITLASGEARTGVGAVLTQGASLSGRVIAADTGLGVNSQVILYRPALGSYVNITNPDGTFTLTDVIPDDYVLYAIPGPFGPSDYAPEYWGGATTLVAATPITLQGGDALAGFTITVDVGLTVSGAVTDPLGNPVADVTVYADTSGYPPGFSVGNVQAVTNAAGTYTLRGLNAGSYPLRFEPPSQTGLLTEYFPNAYDASGQVPLAVNASLTGVNAQLERGIFGTAVLRDSNGPLDSTNTFAAGPGTCRFPAVFNIATISCDGAGFQPFAPDGAGPAWRIGPMAPGTYTTRAARLGNPSGDVVVFTVAVGESFTCDLAFPGAGASSCATATPTPTGIVSGRVTGPDGLGVAGARVTAYLTPNAAIPTQVTTDTLGYYEMGGVPAGNYRLRIEPPMARTDVLAEFWSATGGAISFAEAGDVVVTANATTAGISVRLDAASGGVAVMTDGGIPVPLATGRAVVACPATTTYDLSNGFFICADGSTAVFGQPNGSVGNFESSLTTLPAGTWKLRAVELVFFPTRLGPEATITIGEGDSFSCTLPLDAATPSCTVTPAGPADGDGIAPEVEGDAPNAGDGNNDGTPDALQPEVTSLNDPGSGFITIAVDQPVGATTPEYTLANVEVFDPATPPPSTITPQTGVVGFDVVGLPTGGTATIDVYLPAEADEYWKYDPATDTWSDATSLVVFDPLNPVLIGGEERWHATLTLTDGGDGDQDGVANGVIVDPGVWALGPSDTTPPTISCPASRSVVLNASGAVLVAQVLDDTDGASTTSVPLSTTVLGTNTVTVSATDAAGNTATANCGYQVGVVVQGFHSPINSAAINSIKGGQTVPVKWRTVDANGAPVADPATFVRLRSAAVTQACEPGVSIVSVGEEVATVGNGLKYLGNGEWQLNWKTSSTMRGCRVLVLDTIAGGTTGATFLVR